jgi:tetratricopeptide (TPR) repeat protein
MVPLMVVRGSFLAWLGLPLLAALAYASALHNPFAYDDLSAIQDNALIRQISLAPVFLHGGVSSSGFANGQFRPLTIFSFALNYSAGGVNPFGYRLVNLILHALNAVLGARLLRTLLLRVPFSRRAPLLSPARAEGIALLAAAVFVVHPINSLGVLLVWKRATLLLTLFSLLATSCLLALRRQDIPLWRRSALCVGLWVSQILALGSKENAAILPAMLLLVDLWPRPGWNPREHWRDILRVQFPTFVLGLAGAVLLLTREPHKVEMGRFTYLATQAQVVWSYAAMVVSPSTISTIYDVVPARLHDGLFWLAALSLLGLMTASVWLARRWSFVALALGWAVLGLAPTSSLIPIPLLKDEDRTYLAFLLLWVFPAYAMAWLVGRPQRGRRLAAQLCGSLMLLLLLGSTLARASLWSDPELLWLDAIKKHPGNRLASNNYCAAILSQPGKAHQAVPVCLHAYERDPENPRLQASLINAYVAVGAIDQADAILSTALKTGDSSFLLMRAAGHLAWFHDRPAEAIAYYRRALEKQPLDLEIALYMARSFVELGAVEEARSLAAQLDRWTVPDDMNFQLALAALHREIGWNERACAEYEKLRLAWPQSRATDPDRLKLAAVCP